MYKISTLKITKLHIKYLFLHFRNIYYFINAKQFIIILNLKNHPFLLSFLYAAYILIIFF